MNALGSVWSKWDLHVHTPSTKMSNGYNPDGSDVWDKFCKSIEESDVEVFGITDYFSAENFFTFIDRFKTKYPNSKKIFFLNIELRLEVSVNRNAEEVNLHIIFSDKVEKSKIDSFLSKLNTNINVGGAVLSCKDLTTTHHFQSAGIDYKTLKALLKEVFGDDECYLIIAASNNAGLRPDNNSPRKLNITDEIDKLCDGFFGGQQNIDYYLDENRYEEDEIAEQKPVVTGCDAHSFEDLDNWLGKRFIELNDQNIEIITKDVLWIKAEKTFEGLKQIIFEPKDRVYIGENNPYKSFDKVFFSKVEIDGSQNFPIPNVKLEINRELVAIIGGRGSGKSALLECIAMLNENHVKMDSNGKPKLIEYYRQNIDGPQSNFQIKIKLIDKNGSDTEFSKNIDDHTNYELPFLYIGQEQLNGIATNDKELTEKVCELVGIEDTSESELFLIQSSNEALNNINTFESELKTIKDKYEDYTDQKEFQEWLEEKRIKKQEQFERLTSQTTQTILKNITGITDKGLKLNTLKVKLEQTQQNLNTLAINNDINELNEVIKSLFPESDVEKIPSISITEVNDGIVKVLRKYDTYRAELLTKYNENKTALINSGIKEDVATLIKSAESLQKEITLIEQDKIAFARSQVSLQSEIITRNEILDKLSEFLNTKKDSLTSSFVEFKQSRDDSPENDKNLFKDLLEGIEIKGELNFNQEVFLNYVLEECLNRRRCNTLQGVKELIIGEGENRDITWEDVVTWIKTRLSVLRDTGYFNTHGYETLIWTVFTQWDLFLTVKASVELDGIPTHKLSIGQRGTLLLKIYLATSNAKEICIIDQPEDNLDNKFIMHKLVPLLRKIKKNRQVIISTHNANLVVNTDAEQIIVAMLDSEPKKYITGGIENPTINNAIKDILEGGEDAFKKRKEKYYINK